jgi:hypothetical protein
MNTPKTKTQQPNGEIAMIIRTQNMIPVLIAMFLATLVSMGSAQASVIGYWRFEDSSSLGTDSGPNGLTLGITGSPASVTVGSGSGGGANFPNPVPANGLTNEKGVALTGTHHNHFWLEDSADLFVDTQVTAEIFFNQTTIPGSTPTGLVGQWRDASNNRSWGLGIDINLNPRFATSSNGQAGTVIAQSATLLHIALNTDYYLAAAYNAGSVTFYLKDLSNPSNPLQTQTVSGYNTTLHDSTDRFYVGLVAWGSVPALNGVMDEVRVSNTALGESQLLIIPEPGTLVLAGLGLAYAAGRRRRRRA